MRKMPCLFERDFGTTPPTLLRTVTPGCEWVLQGEGHATRKYDGTACAVIGGRLYARYDAKRGKVPPVGAIPCCDPDPITGHWPHWVLVEEQPQYRWHRVGWKRLVEIQDFFKQPIEDGTYELIGPPINGNHEGFKSTALVKHGCDVYIECPRNWDALQVFLGFMNIEGIVWHHPDGRMVKLRKADFGIERKAPVMLEVI